MKKAGRQRGFFDMKTDSFYAKLKNKRDLYTTVKPELAKVGSLDMSEWISKYHGSEQQPK